MSADTRPIPPARFAAALKELSVGTLHLKVLEIRNSIAHLQYSNDQLRPFAEGSAVALSSSTTTEAAAQAQPDQDCIDAIRENEQVIERMAERIAIVRAEVEERGLSWTEFQSKDEAEVAAAAAAVAQDEQADTGTTTTNGAPVNGGSGSDSPWTDGTFQTGTISSDGQVRLDSQPGRPAAAAATAPPGGGSLSDEELRRRLEERMRDLGTGDDDEGDGVFL